MNNQEPNECFSLAARRSVLFVAVLFFVHGQVQKSVQSEGPKGFSMSNDTAEAGADPGFQKGGWMADHIY